MANPVKVKFLSYTYQVINEHSKLLEQEFTDYVNDWLAENDITRARLIDVKYQHYITEKIDGVACTAVIIYV